MSEYYKVIGDDLYCLLERSDLATDYERLTVSADKWFTIHKYWVNGVRVNPGGTNTCPLCWEYRAGIHDDCKGCPVNECTGQRGCHGTPWEYATFFAPESAAREAKFLIALRDGMPIVYCEECMCHWAGETCPGVTRVVAGRWWERGGSAVEWVI